MIDKPIAAKIILSLASSDSTGEEFISLSPELYRQGLIFAEPRELRKNDNNLELTVIFSDIYSFNNWPDQLNASAHWSEIFAKLLGKPPITIAEEDVIIEIDREINCSCKDSEIEFYLLDGRRYRFTGGLICGNCLGKIPSYKISPKIKLENWLSDHECVYSLWLKSGGVLERWALKELKNYIKGKLNLEGQKIRSELSVFFNKPVYISFFTEEPDIDRNCPLCGSDGEISGLKKPLKFCRNCSSNFDYTN